MTVPNFVMPFSATFLPNMSSSAMEIVPEHRNNTSARLSIMPGVNTISIVSNSVQQIDLRQGFPGKGTELMATIPSGSAYRNKPVMVNLTASDANSFIEIHMQRAATISEVNSSMMVGVTVVNTPPVG